MYLPLSLPSFYLFLISFSTTFWPLSLITSLSLTVAYTNRCLSCFSSTGYHCLAWVWQHGPLAYTARCWLCLFFFCLIFGFEFWLARSNARCWVWWVCLVGQVDQRVLLMVDQWAFDKLCWWWINGVFFFLFDKLCWGFGSSRWWWRWWVVEREREEERKIRGRQIYFIV